ncbi:ig group 2 domain-containing [Fusarium longipes]|uniref:Ig group 2 domain-containing n=1 Tax=Fusarium longipes TaxID=694270 RepID=A0A395T1Z6_9HYPO|nr:ig group 2 domain-containing [Fusarium longipes]
MRFSPLAVICTLFTFSSAAPCADTDAQDALSFAYMYGFPLYAFGDVARPLLAAGIPLRPNVNIASPEPNEPGAVGVVRPNADTMYSILFIDLSSQDLRVTIPKMPEGRYWVFPFCSPYGDDLVNLGNLGGSEPGDYLVRYNSRSYGLQTDDVPQGYVGVVNFPMPYGLVNSRIVTDRTDEDVAIVANLQKGFRVRPVPRSGKPVAPALDLSMFAKPEYTDQNQTEYQAVMNTAAALTPHLPPYIISDRKSVAQTLKKAGFKNGKFVQPSGTDLTAAVETANKTSKAFASRPDVSLDVGNGWYLISEEYIGRFDSNYAMRYQIGLTAYLALTQSECAYPSFGSFEATISVAEGQSILWTFTAPPKIREGGFWSLTAYGPDQDLIPNEQEKYMVGDRSNLTFPDGSPLEEGGEGPFEVLLQDAEIAPPSNWTNNWLPINSGGGNISVTMRWYGAEEEMVDGTYVHPKMTFIDAIKA